MTRTQRLTLLGVAVGAVCLATGATPSEPARVQQQGSAAVWLLPSPDAKGRLHVRLSAVVTVKLTVNGNAPLQVEPIRRITDAAAWKMTNVSPPLVGPCADHMCWEQTFQLMPLDQGDQPLPLAPLKYRWGKGEWQTVAWQPIPVTVTSVINRVDVSDASDITDIEYLPTPSPWWEVLMWPALGLLALLLALAAWLMARRWRHSAAPLAPDQAALRELDHLLALNLPHAGRAGRFSFLVSNILRRYLEKRYQLPARRQTTAEFLAALGQMPLLEPCHQELLRDFLERCDLAKFAGVAPTPQECQHIAAAARLLLEQTAQKGEPGA